MVESKLRLISGSTNPQLAEEIAKALGVPLTKTTLKRFSDGEIYIKVDESARGDDFFVIQSTSSPVNESLMELLIIIDALKRASANSITAVIPYYGYARQDRKARSREPITAKLVADLIVRAGATRVLTMDLHAAQIQGFFDIPVDNLDGVPLVARYFQDQDTSDLVVVAPDVGGVRRARAIATILQTPIAIIDKRRTAHNEAEVVHIVGDVKDKNCLLVDDMIDTAGTIVNGVSALKNHGAKKVSIAATHGVLSGPAVDRLNNSEAEEVVLTNTIPVSGKPLGPKFQVLCVSPLLSEAISRIQNHKSLSALFDDALSMPSKRLVQ